MRTSALFGTETSDFSKFIVCLHGQGENGVWASADILRTRGGRREGQFFAILCWRLLWTDP